MTDPLPDHALDPERLRLAKGRAGGVRWDLWGPYLAERQWGAVREDYPPSGDAWDDCPHEHARSRAYRWGENGLLGISDDQSRLCFSLALWNSNDPILKERLFGLTGPEGNHGEDVKESYYYLDSTPTHGYLKGLYTYPHGHSLTLISSPRTAATADDGHFDSGDQGLGDRYAYTFTEPGAYHYYCRYHGDVGGAGMAGTIVVEQATRTLSRPNHRPGKLGNYHGQQREYQRCPD